MDDIRLVTAYGGYAAYRHVYSVNEDGSYWTSNFFGGIAQASIRSIPQAIPTRLSTIDNSTNLG